MQDYLRSYDCFQSLICTTFSDTKRVETNGVPFYSGWKKCIIWVEQFHGHWIFARNDVRNIEFSKPYITDVLTSIFALSFVGFFFLCCRLRNVQKVFPIVHSQQVVLEFDLFQRLCNLLCYSPSYLLLLPVFAITWLVWSCNLACSLFRGILLELYRLVAFFQSAQKRDKIVLVNAA